MKAVLLIVCLVFASHAYAVPSFQETRDSYRKSDAVLRDRHGELIHELRVDSRGRRLDWVDIREISPSLIKAVIHSEDRRFYEHSGVDWRAAGAAAMENLFSRSSRGASTITMQLASIIDGRLKSGNSKKTLSQKWRQMKAAGEIEGRWTKDQILEAYLNLATFRGELQGISSASRGLFDKEPGGLDEAESSVLATLLRSPNASVETVAKRACALGRAIRPSLGCEDITAVARSRLSGVYSVRQRMTLAPHAAHLLLKNGRTSVVSSLDGELQRFGAETLRHHLAAVKSRNVNDGAVLVVENSTGQILAYIGSTGDNPRTRYVDGIQAGRQAGSTLKPFLYATAFEKGILTPASVIHDSPLEVSTATGIYRPENYDSDFKGMVSARTALASSLNVPAVRVLSLVGVDTFVAKLKQLGFDRLRGEDYYGPSLALGSADVSLWELVNAYRTLANHGVWGEMSLTPEKSGERKRAFSERAAFLVSDILSDREARSATFSFENPLSTRYRSAAKTGTSKDMRDNWCVGYSDKYTVGVWVGNFSGEPMWNVSGVTGAAPVWLEVMNFLHRGGSAPPPAPPPGIVAVNVTFPGTVEPPRTEWFMVGTEPPETVTSAKILPGTTHARGKIISPTRDSLLALDPDIPGEFQRLFFEAEAGGAHYRWVLDGETMGTTDEPVSWKPVRGKHLLSLADERMTVVDSVTFEVRGYGPD